MNKLCTNVAGRTGNVSCSVLVEFLCKICLFFSLVYGSIACTVYNPCDFCGELPLCYSTACPVCRNVMGFSKIVKLFQVSNVYFFVCSYPVYFICSKLPAKFRAKHSLTADKPNHNSPLCFIIGVSECFFKNLYKGV